MCEKKLLFTKCETLKTIAVLEICPYQACLLLIVTLIHFYLTVYFILNLMYKIINEIQLFFCYCLLSMYSC